MALLMMSHSLSRESARLSLGQRDVAAVAQLRNWKHEALFTLLPLSLSLTVARRSRLLALAASARMCLLSLPPFLSPPLLLERTAAEGKRER